jgi:hypothetical protein
MELTFDVSSAVCPHCGAVKLFPGFSEIRAFTCKEYGEVAKPFTIVRMSYRRIATSP